MFLKLTNDGFFKLIFWTTLVPVLLFPLLDLRWQNWVQDVNNITDFVRTGRISDTCRLSEANKTELVQAAQRYYIYSKLMQCSCYFYLRYYHCDGQVLKY